MSSSSYFMSMSKKSGGALGRVLAIDSIGNRPHAKNNKLVVGSGIGAMSVGNRRAQLRRAAQPNTSVCYMFSPIMRNAL